MKREIFLAGLLAVVVVAAYGHTLQMYFWQDDNGYIFKLQHPWREAGPYGPNAIGSGPYKYQATFAMPFYPFFGLNPIGYFAYGLVMYFLAAVSVYFFAWQVFENKKTGYIAALIFASGYIGAESLFRITNTYQTSMAIILASLSFGFLFKHLYRGGLVDYFTSLVLFYAAVEIVQLRSHGLIFAVIVALLLFSKNISHIKNVFLMFIKLAPFLYIFNAYYFYFGYKGGFVTSEGSRFLRDFFVEGHYEYLFTVLSIYANLLLPDYLINTTKDYLGAHANQFMSPDIIFAGGIFALFTLISLATKLIFQGSKKLLLVVITLGLVWLVSNLLLSFNGWPLFVQQFFMPQVVIGGLFVVYAVYLLLLVSGGKEPLWKIIIFSLLWIFANFAAVFIHFPLNVLTTTHRYLSVPLVGWAILNAFFLVLIQEESWRRPLPLGRITKIVVGIGRHSVLIGLCGILSLNIYLNAVTQRSIIANRSLPTVQFYKSLLQQLPVAQKEDVFFFDVQNEAQSQSRFYNFFAVASMPETTALAIYYDLDRYDIKMLPFFNEVLFHLSKKTIALSQLHTFFYGQDGLIDTSKQVQQALTVGGYRTFRVKSQTTSVFNKIADTTIGYTPPLIAKFDQPVVAYTPLELELTVTMQPIKESLVIPYHQAVNQDALSQTMEIRDGQAMRTGMPKDLWAAFSYLHARREYLRDAEATSTSSWKYHEIEQVKDGKEETDWMGHVGHWQYFPTENIIVDLKKNKKIGRVVWVSGHPQRTPADYTLAVSLDGINWQTVKQVSHLSLRLGEVIVDDFDARNARFLRMAITKTAGSDSPQIAELEVVEEQYKVINPALAWNLLGNPFQLITSGEDLAAAWRFANSGEARVKLHWRSIYDQDWQKEKFMWFDVIVDGASHTYRVILPVNGNGALSQIKIDNLTFPVRAELSNVAVRYLSLDDLVNRHLIRELKDN